MALLGPIPGHAQPVEADRLYREGTEARREGRFGAAVEALRDAAAMQPANADTQVQLGLALLGAGDLDAAEVTLRGALALAPDYSDARIGLARIALRRADLDAAERTLAPVLAAEPDRVDAQALRVQIETTRQDQTATAERQTLQRAAADQAARARREADRSAETLERLTREARALRAKGRFAEARTRYEAALRHAPNDADLLVGLGLTQGAEGDYAAARARFEKAMVADPRTLDARLGLARVSLWDGRLDEAETRVAEILRGAPDDPETLSLRARLQLVRGEASEAEAGFAALVALDPRNADALVGLGDARRARLREPAARAAYAAALALDPASADIRSRFDFEAPPRWRLDLDGSRSSFSGDRQGWRESAIHLGYAVSPQTSLTFGVELSRRAGDFDAYLEARFDRRVTPAFSAYGLIGATPDADFRPDLQLGLGAGLRLRSGGGMLGPTTATLDLRHADYAGGGIETVSPGLEQYFLDGRFWATARWINIFDPDAGHAAGWSLRLDAQLTPRLRVAGGLSDAPDISEGVVLETMGSFGTIVFDVSDRLSLRAALAHEDRDTSADRTEFGLGLGIRF